MGTPLKGAGVILRILRFFGSSFRIGKITQGRSVVTRPPNSMDCCSEVAPSFSRALDLQGVDEEDDNAQKNG